MTQHTFKSAMREGTFKRADSFTVLYEDLVVEAGFNLREEGPELDEHRQAMLAHLKSGGDFPPMEVRVDPETGKPVIVDGHNRHWVYGEGLRIGLPLRDDKTGEFRLPVIPFRGNDLDRLVRVITSQEGRKLTPLELANGYKRLNGFRMDAEAIAKRFSKTRQHVEQLLILANANEDVKALVHDGYVSAALAIDAVRKHGDEAGDFLSKQLDKAKGQGRAKVTPGVVNGKALPKKVLTGLVEEVDAFMELLPKDARQKLAAIETAAAGGLIPEGQSVSVPAGPLLALLRQHSEVEEARTKAEAKARVKAAKASQGELPTEPGAA